jgi:Zn-dependent M28 family amino/carboxypeptidase
MKTSPFLPFVLFFVTVSQAQLSADALLNHIKILSSDDFEGRSPGTKGETLTVNYLTEQFKRMGIKPGNPNGTYSQQVPLVGFTAQNPSGWFMVGDKKIETEFPKNMVMVSRRQITDEINVENSDMLFVGYGTVAPEYGWDDFKDVDVKGKTIVILINDPQIPDPRRKDGGQANDPTKLDEKMFKGKAMTYYGRWTYKYEAATEKGAAAAIIIHETGPAGYPFEVVSGSWSRENFDIKQPDKNINRVAIESWITEDKARELFTAAGKSFDDLKKSALDKNFRPVPLGAAASFRLKNSLREVQSNNVLGKLEGSDPKLKNEYIIYTAHWDHLGKDPNREGDQIFNGALDNASGTALVLEMAKAFASKKPAPKRSILFLFVTAEERGLLGAKFYAANPLYPLAKTVANINIDGINTWGRTRDMEVIGMGMTTLEDLVVEITKKQKRVVLPDSEPEKGFFYRSDQFEFAKQGVPALYAESGIGYIDKPEGFGKEKRDEYTKNDYHKVSDEIKPGWDLSGAVEDGQLLMEVGYRVANADKWPEWKPGAEFKAKREEMLKKSK